jgi:hypothetical protein
MKTYIRLIALTIFISISLQSQAQKSEKVTIYKKNGDILKGTVEYVSESNKVRLNTECCSFLIDREDIQEIKSMEALSGPKSKFYGNAQIGLLVGYNGGDFQGIPFDFTVSGGYRPTSHLGIGVASGLVFLNNTYVPIAAELQYNFSPRLSSTKSHFFRLKVGMPYLISTSSTTYDYPVYSSAYPYYYQESTEPSNKKGFLFNPEFGVKFSGAENESFYLSLGYYFQWDRYDYKNSYAQTTTENHSFNRLSLNFGYIF